MMGLGSFGYGGSSSSSNLSPLAPPFTVDRSNSKPSSNPTVTVPFGLSWQFPEPSVSDPVFSPSTSVNPSSTIWSTSNPTAQTSTEAYSFGCEGYYEPTFDVFPNLGNVPVNASSQVDYTQSLSGLEYPVPRWDHVWSQKSDGKQDERNGIDGSFSSDKVNPGAPFGYRNCMSQGYSVGNSLEGVNIAGEDSRALSGKFTDRLYTGPSSMGHVDDKSYLAQEPFYTSFNSKASCMDTIPPESCQDERKGIGGSFSTDKVNPGAPFGYRNCMSQGNSLEGVNIAGEDSCALSGNFTDRLYTGQSSMGHMDDKSYLAQEPFYPSFNSKASCMSMIPPESCQGGLSSGSSKNYLNPFTPSVKFGQPLDSFFRDTTVSTSKSSPAVVIRPAPSGTRFSTQKLGLNKTVDIFKAGNNEKSEVKGFSLDTNLLNLGNNECSSHTEIIAPPVTFTEKGSEAHNPNVDSPCWKGSPAFRISLCDSVEASNPWNYLFPPTETEKFGEDNPHEHNLYAGVETTNATKETFEHMPSKESSGVNAGLNLNDTLEGGVVALDAAEKVLRSPASQEDAKQSQPYQILSPKLDVHTLVNAVHNLSELLKSQCSTNDCLLEEQDHDALNHAITNLGACVSKMETKEKIFPQHDTFEKARESNGCYVGTGIGHPQFVDEVTSDSCGLGYRLMHEDKNKNNGKKADNSPFLTPFQDGLGDSKEEHVALAIKKALDENFICDDDMQLQALLFKQLWLEAEAKLCSISYKARFDHMKMEMMKHKMSLGKDINVNSSVAPEAENDLASNITQSPSTSSKSVPVDCSDDSLLERFNILSRREEKLSSSEIETSVVGSDALKQQGNASDVVADDAEDSVMERFNILRRRGDNLKSSFMKLEKDENVVADEAKDSVMARLDILRQQGDSLSTSCMEEKNVDDSVMARFNMLGHKGENLNSQKVNVDERANVVIEPYFYYQTVNVDEGKFGSCADGSGYDSMKQFLLSAVDDPIVYPNRMVRLGNHQSSGLCDNSSDWEHVAKDEFV